MHERASTLHTLHLITLSGDTFFPLPRARSAPSVAFLVVRLVVREHPVRRAGALAWRFIRHATARRGREFLHASCRAAAYFVLPYTSATGGEPE